MKTICRMATTVIVILTITVLLTSCEIEERNQNNASDSTTKNDNKNSYYTLADSSTDLATLIYLGGPDNYENGKAIMQEKFFSNLDSHWLDNVKIVETEGWNEVYLIVPKYEKTDIEIFLLDTDENIVKKLASANGPVLLKINKSDIIPSVQLKVVHLADEIVFRPRLSSKDGSVVATKKIFTTKCD